MNTIIINSEKSISVYHSILRIKCNWEEKKNILPYQILVFMLHGEIYKSHIRIINLKFQLRHGMKNFNYLMDHILYQIFKIILNIY